MNIRPWRLSWAQGLGLILLFSVGLVWVVQSFVLAIYAIPSDSMSPTLQTGDRVLVLHTGVDSQSISDGDVVVFHRPQNWPRLTGSDAGASSTLVKRVVALPGQTVSCCDVDGNLQRDGQSIDESGLVENMFFIPGVLDCTTTPSSARCFSPVRVPEDSYLVLGDSRANSVDSLWNCRHDVPPDSCAVFVPHTDVIGRVLTITWPLSRVGSSLSVGQAP
ncbi:MAG: signal peptidase I [Microbacteriaceae bacterium]